MSVTLSALTLLLDWDRLIDVESGIKYVLTTKTTTSSSSIIGVGTKSQRKRESNRKKGREDRQMNREKETALHESKSLHNFKVRRRSVNNRRLNWANEKKVHLIWIWKPVCQIISSTKLVVNYFLKFHTFQWNIIFESPVISCIFFWILSWNKTPNGSSKFVSYFETFLLITFWWISSKSQIQWINYSNISTYILRWHTASIPC